MSILESLYGKRYFKNKGYVALVGQGSFNHKFGGSLWSSSSGIIGMRNPSLLITLDLKDPVLKKYQGIGIEELPFCCELDYVSVDRQVYQIDNNTKAISLISIDEQKPELLREEDLQTGPLSPKQLILQPMDQDDYPLNEESYWQCCDGFLGGKSVVRVLGPPVWMDEPEQVLCDCGKTMDYICSVGYEIDNAYRQLLDDGPFFPGELAHYFFFCKSCLKTATLVQST